jgi:hypothetical protein
MKGSVNLNLVKWGAGSMRQVSCKWGEKLTRPASCVADGLVKCNWAGKAGKVRLWDLW